MRLYESRLARRLAGITLAAGIALASAAAQAESVVRIANFGEPTSLDPHRVAGTWEHRILGEMFLGLMTEDQKAEPVLGAAAKFTVSDDGLVYTFQLRPNKWSDGTPVTADDYVFAFRRVLDPATAAEYASLLYPVKNAEAVNTGKMDKAEVGVRALDPMTVEITLESPTPYLLGLLTHYTAWPVPRHVVEKFGDEWVKPGNIVSNGAYKLAEYVPNDHVTLERNPEFYDAANVAIDKLVFYPQEDRAAAFKRYRAGEVDVMTDLASDQIELIRKTVAKGEVRIVPYLGVYYYALNVRQAPFDDVRVRKALSMVIDRETITDKVMKTGEVAAYSWVPPGTAGYGAPGEVPWKSMKMAERVKEAKKLLAEAGYGKNKPLKFQLSYNTSENHKRIAVAVAAMWKQQLGVEAELFNSEAKVHYNQLQQGNFEVGRAAWVADYNDAQNFLYLMEGRTGPLNYAGYKNEKFDSLMQEASRTTDLDKRADLMRQAEVIAMAEEPNIPIYHYTSKQVVSNKLQGWVDNAQDVHWFRYMTLAD